MKSIFPIIVIYKVQLDESISYQSLVRPNQFAEFLVYDNSPASYQQNEAALPAGAIYVRNTNNGGLSEAYNQGAEIARERDINAFCYLTKIPSLQKGLWHITLNILIIPAS